MHLVGFITKTYHNAWSPGRQTVWEIIKRESEKHTQPKGKPLIPPNSACGLGLPPQTPQQSRVPIGKHQAVSVFPKFGNITLFRD